MVFELRSPSSLPAQWDENSAPKLYSHEHRVLPAKPPVGRAIFWGEAIHKLCSSCLQLPIAEAKFQVSVAEKWRLLLPHHHWWDGGHTVPTAPLRILEPWLLFPWLVGWEFCAERDKPRRPGAADFPTTECAASEEECHSEKRVPLSPSLASMTWLRDFCLRGGTGHKTAWNPSPMDWFPLRQCRPHLQ